MHVEAGIIRAFDPRRRVLALVLAALAAGLLAAPATAGARPTVTGVQGFYLGERDSSDYVVFDVSATGSGRVFLRWPGHGGAIQRVRRGRVTLGFAKEEAGPNFRVRVKTCRASGRPARCGRARTFRGTFAPMPQPTPGSGGTGEPPDSGGGLPGIIDGITIPITPPVEPGAILPVP